MEAVQAEKFFSDFLNTSDKKAKLDTPCESESDDEGKLDLCNVFNGLILFVSCRVCLGGKVSAKAVEITDYNATFNPVAEEKISSESMTVDEPADENQANHVTPDDIVRVSAEPLPLMNIELDNFSDIVDFEVNKTLISDSVAYSTSNDPDEMLTLKRKYHRTLFSSLLIINKIRPPKTIVTAHKS